MEKHSIRLLKANEIECRISTISEKGVSLLLYKDARVDKKILDETFGMFGWKRSHQCINGNLYCTVEIYDSASGTWIAKQDVGAAGQMEKEKSQASDSFKRACFNWGIGRELYTAPFIWVPAGKAVIQKKGDRYICSSRFSLVSISYNEEREISSLEVTDEKGHSVYQWKMENSSRTIPDQEKALSKNQIESLAAELKRTGVSMETVQERYQIGQPEQMSEDIYQKVMSALKKTKAARAA